MLKNIEKPTSSLHKDLPLVKPIDSIKRLFGVINEDDQAFSLSKKKMFCFSEKMNDFYVYLITEGRFSIIRDRDGICVVSGSAPLILGASIMLREKRYGDYAIIAETDCSGYRIRGDEMKNRITRHGLWADVANIMAYAIQVFMRRDKYLVGVDAYTMIKYFLLKINDLPSEDKMGINVEKFINQRTGLSRSGIMKILSDLKIGGYIAIERGRLIKVNNLPEYY